MRQLPEEFWAALDESPQRRAGGFIIGVELPGHRLQCNRVETRSQRTRFPRREVRMRRLELQAHLLDKEEQQ